MADKIQIAYESSKKIYIMYKEIDFHVDNSMAYFHCEK